MTRRRTFAYVLLAVLLVLLVAAHGASAASPSTIWEDAGDGVIDGDYSVTDLRAANANVPAELREYHGWDEAYQDALRRKYNPDEPPVVAPRDSNRNGKIDTEERRAAEEATRRLNASHRNPTGSGSEGPSAEDCDEDADSDACNEDAEPVNASDDDDGGGSRLVWLVVGLPLVIVLVGAWRMLRSRGAGDSNPAAAPHPDPSDPPKTDEP